MQYVPAACLALAIAAPLASAQLVVSANENKLTLTGGTAYVADPQPDSLTILNFAAFPPTVEHVIGVPNTVIGPPSNLALTADGSRLVLASSVVADPDGKEGWKPDNLVMLIDLTQQPARVIQRIEAGVQPSGLAISPDGSLVLVANRGDTTVSVFALRDDRLTLLDTVQVCEPGEAPADVGIAPDGKLALVAVNRGQYLRVLRIDGERVTATDRKLAVFGHPYRSAVSPDGTFAAAVGWGHGGERDAAAVSIIDLTGDEPRTSAYLATGCGTESLVISPDGNAIAVVLINGSNAKPDAPHYRAHGEIDLFVRDDDHTWRHAGRTPVGRIPEGAAFTRDGRYLVVQCHADRELWVLAYRDAQLHDTGERIATPGMPSGMAAQP